MNGPTPLRAATLQAVPSADHESKLAHAQAVLSSAASEHGDRIVQASSLGAEDMVITDLIASLGLPITVATLDTGMLHAQTLALLPRIARHYGIEVQVFRPGETAVIDFVARHGEHAMFESVALRKGCCAVRKLEPLSRLLAGRAAWVTGLRREQSEHRAEVPFSERDEQGRVKLNPLADWTWGDVWHHIARRGVPYNELHDHFYPSIGCVPCTRAVALGEDFRAGRWWWEQGGAKECGLHLHTSQGRAP